MLLKSLKYQILEVKMNFVLTKQTISVSYDTAFYQIPAQGPNKTHLVKLFITTTNVKYNKS